MKSAILSLLVAAASSSTLVSSAWIPATRFDLSRRDNSTAFVQCLSDGGLSPVVQGDSAYANDSAAFNLRFSFKPVALVHPNKTEDVAAAVKCAADNNVKVNGRSGGHSYAAFSLGGEDGHLIVSLDNLRDLTVDGENASIGAGNHVGDILLGLWNQGKRALAHATGVYVGIGGQASHGGFGLPSRSWGLLLDQIYEVEVVTAAGDIVTANSNDNSDLFWAIRGAGSSFGIVTTWKAKTHPAPEHNVWASYTWQNFTPQASSDAIQKWQKFSVDAPELLGLQIHVGPTGDNSTGNTFTIDGVWYGDDGIAGSNSTFAPLLEQLPTPDQVTVEDQSWLDSAINLAGVKSADDLDTTKAPDSHDNFFADSIMIPESAPMTPETSLAFSQYLWDQVKADVGWFVILDLYGGKNSLIRNTPLDSTSFDPRDTLYSIQVYGSATSGDDAYPDDGIDVIKGMVKSITDNQPDVKYKGYANYVDSTLSRDQAHQYYYPTHTSKLETVKAKWDPKSVFDFPQAFLPASSS